MRDHASGRCADRCALRCACHRLRVSPAESALFVDAQPQQVREALSQAPVNLLQFHGAETPEYCRQFGLPYMKAVRVRAGVNLLQYASDYQDAQALLLDAFVDGVHGGTGATFDWDLIPQGLPLPVV